MDIGWVHPWVGSGRVRNLHVYGGWVRKHIKIKEIVMQYGVLSYSRLGQVTLLLSWIGFGLNQDGLGFIKWTHYPYPCLLLTPRVCFIVVGILF